MVEHSASNLDRVFAAVSDPTRRAILTTLKNGPATVTEISGGFSVSLNAISKHLMVLERAGLIQREVKGRERHCHLVARPLRDADQWLNGYREFWEVRLDALSRYVIAKKKRKKSSEAPE